MTNSLSPSSCIISVKPLLGETVAQHLYDKATSSSVVKSEQHTAPFNFNLCKKSLTIISKPSAFSSLINEFHKFASLSGNHLASGEIKTVLFKSFMQEIFVFN